VDKLEQRTDHYVRKIATEFLTEPLKGRSPQHMTDRYQKMLDEINTKYPNGFPYKNDPINLFEAAKCNEITQELYTTVFRLSSSDSTHINSGSLARHFRQVDGKGVVAIGIHTEGLLSTLSQMFVVLHLAITQVQKSKGSTDLDGDILRISGKWDARGFPPDAT
jgi:hypothetical protein